MNNDSCYAKKRGTKHITKHSGKWRQEDTELKARLGCIIKLGFNNNAKEEELDGREECLTNLCYMSIPRSIPQVSLDSFQNSGLVRNFLSTPALTTYQASAVANVDKPSVCSAISLPLVHVFFVSFGPVQNFFFWLLIIPSCSLVAPQKVQVSRQAILNSMFSLL